MTCRDIIIDTQEELSYTYHIKKGLLINYSHYIKNFNH
jgi:hypothetical protein